MAAAAEACIDSVRDAFAQHGHVHRKSSMHRGIHASSEGLPRWNCQFGCAATKRRSPLNIPATQVGQPGRRLDMPQYRCMHDAQNR